MQDDLMRIGEMAAFFNVSVKALRIYEKMGIIKPAKIDEWTGYRYYSAEQVSRLETLLELKQLGFSLLEIKDLLKGNMSGESFMEALVHKKIKWKEAIAAAEHKMQAIDSIAKRIRGSNPAVKIHELTDDERVQLLGKLVCVEDLNGKRVLSEALWL